MSYKRRRNIAEMFVQAGKLHKFVYIIIIIMAFISSDNPGPIETYSAYPSFHSFQSLSSLSRLCKKRKKSQREKRWQKIPPTLASFLLRKIMLQIFIAFNTSPVVFITVNQLISKAIFPLLRKFLHS